MAKNRIGREDPFLDNRHVVYGGFPSIEGAVQSVTGVTLPFADVSRGKGLPTLASNAAVLAEGAARRLSGPAMPPAENALSEPPAPSAEKIRQLRDLYLANKRAAGGQGKAFYPSME